MKRPVYSLRSGILTQLIFLIIAAMLLINVIMVKFSERDLIQAKEQTGQLLIRAVEQNLGFLPDQKRKGLKGIDSDSQIKKNITKLLAGGGFSDILIINERGEPVFPPSPAGKTVEVLPLTRGAMETGIWSTDFKGNIWGVMWLNKERIRISAPLLFEGCTLGGITISSSLSPIYQTLRRSEKMVLLYIFMDTIILAIVGMYLLSRIVVRPINKLLQMTKEYKEGGVIPSLPEISGNEMGRLSRSLQIMLKRLDENKKELKAHISSLEKANEELNQAQDEIIRTEKLASVGRLAAGIAHEIGNPIGIILGYLELIKKGAINKEEGADFLNRMEIEITRISEIIRNLLDFSRPSSGRPEETNIQGLILNTIDILKLHPIMEEIRVNYEFNTSIATLPIDPNQMKQVFLNIIMNAADSFDGKDFSNNNDIDKEVIIESRNIDNAIELRFIDNGSGIPKEEIDQIFDPFYTTKEPGKGTGLGLSVCYRIIEDAGGIIQAESIEGKGTTMIIILPLYEREKGGQNE